MAYGRPKDMVSFSLRMDTMQSGKTKDVSPSGKHSHTRGHLILRGQPKQPRGAMYWPVQLDNSDDGTGHEIL